MATEEYYGDWDCETHGCRIVEGYCRYCEVSADGFHNKPLRQPRAAKESTDANQA